MTDKEKLEKIRSEVIWYIRLRNEGLIIGSCGDFEKLLSFIDSLREEPVSEDFEKIVEEIAEPTILNAYGAKELARRLRNTIRDTSVSEDLEEASRNYADNEEYGDDVYYAIKAAFEVGAKWQKEQMTVKAIEGGCFSYKNGFVHISCDIEEHLTDIKIGDKVKVIVIKEE